MSSIDQATSLHYDLAALRNTVPKELKISMMEHLKIDEHTFTSAFDEFLKYVVIALNAPHLAAAGTPYRFIPVVKLIDEIWHFYLLQTEEYAKLCDIISPGNFLHHRTFLYDKHVSDVIRTELLHQEDLDFLVNYRLRFGYFTAQSIGFWRVPLCLQAELEWNIDKVNQFIDEACSLAVIMN
jgi:hypothetical protein